MLTNLRIHKFAKHTFVTYKIGHVVKFEKDEQNGSVNHFELINYYVNLLTQ